MLSCCSHHPRQTHNAMMGVHGAKQERECRQSSSCAPFAIDPLLQSEGMLVPVRLCLRMPFGTWERRVISAAFS